MLRRASFVLCLVVAGCGDPVEPLKTAAPGVIFTYPNNGQVDVPLGSRIVITFSDPVVESAAASAVSLVGPAGPVQANVEVSDNGKTVSVTSDALAAGTTYDVQVQNSLAPSAENIPGTGPLLSFTTRNKRPRAAAPTLLAVNGGDPTKIGTSFRPMFETTTLRLVFSEPLDPRSIKLGSGGIELLDSAGAAVAATLLSNGIHVSIDPKTDLTPGAMYTLRLGNQLLDLGGQALMPISMQFTPQNSRGSGTISQVLRTRQSGDPGPAESRSGVVPNEIVMDKPLIGRETTKLEQSALAAELGDPKALGGPIAFTLRKGQRLKSTGLDIKLGGEIPSGLSTGELQIELLTDAGGRLYRNPYQPAEQRPENERAPLYVDLSLDLAIYATDATGNASVTQTVLGVQATGTAIATDGVLAIENVASMDMGLLGVTAAPTNMVMELITDTSAPPPAADTQSPKLVSSMPSMSSELPVDAGIELIFDEPIDIDRARAGIRLEDTVSGLVPTTIESHGAAVVLRPLTQLQYSKIYRIVFMDVADVAGNKLTMNPLSFVTPTLLSTNIGPSVSAVYPGVACALTGATATSPGRCAGGQTTDELYKPFTIAADQPIEVAFTAPIRRNAVVRGTACNQGNVRIEEVDAAGACTAIVPGTLMARDSTLSFIPDQPWTVGKQYRLTLVSGGNATCDAGELCGASSAANFDPIAGDNSGDAGGPALQMTYTATAPTGGTFMVTSPYPFTDVNGSGIRDSSEQPREDNRAALRIIGTTGAISAATFDDPDCIASTPEKENCMYLVGSMPADMGEATTTCPLPGGASAPVCIPVKLSAEAMYGTSVAMTATALGLPIGTSTGIQVMRVREPTAGPVMGYIIDRNGTPTMVVALELYMDAPDMSVPLSSHDLHSKPLSVQLEGPVTFLSDGRIIISLANTADLPVTVHINGVATGDVKMIVPKGEMHLSLLSPAQRGVSL
ncbi:MAG TPA: Ig-like domain-containing protein [Kofleriaceae bacterium]